MIVGSFISNARVRHYWQEQEEMMTHVYKHGLCSLLKPAHSLSSQGLLDRDLRCIDGGTPGGLHCAGSGILMSESEILKSFANAQVTGVYSHEECGAAKLYCKLNGFSEDQADVFAQEIAAKTARILKVPYKGHISILEMRRPEGFHNERIIYYDMTAQFDPELWGLPLGFVITRKFLGANLALKELEIALSIAFGDHGFNNLFSEQTPLIIALVVSNSSVAINLTNEVIQATSSYRGKVRSETLVIP